MPSDNRLLNSEELSRFHLLRGADIASIEGILTHCPVKELHAGEVLIAVVAFFVPYVLPSSLMLFEMFVGVVQAGIFTLLMLFFIKMAITAPHDEH